MKKTTKKRGRPATGESTQAWTRLPPDMLEQLDAWCAAHGGVGRSTAIKIAIAALVKQP